MELEVGAASRTAAHALAICIGGYALATGWYAWRGRRLADRLSATVATLVMAALAALLWTEGPALLPSPFSVWALVAFLAGIAVSLTWTLSRYQERVDRFKEAFGDRMATLLEQVLPEERQEALRRLLERARLGHEARRKTPHLMMGVIVAGYLGLGGLVVKVLARVPFTGAVDEGPANLDAAAAAPWLVSGHLAMMAALLMLLLLIVPNELLRLRYPELSYPFKTSILRRLREKEKGLFGAHYYIVATLPLACLWVARDPAQWPVGIPAAIAIVCVTVFADAASALIGINLGRRKWPHNPRKSYAGTYGGGLVALLVALPFVGMPVAVATAAAFIVVDILAPVPFNASDNLLNPVALALLYTWLWPYLDPVVPFY